MLLRSPTLPDGRVCDVRVDGPTVSEVAPQLTALPGEEVLDLTDRLLLPGFAEPHAHLDKAFLAERVENHTGDLMGAIEAMRASRHLITLDDTIERAERAARLMASHGVTLIRSHADTTLDHGLQSVEALVEVRRRVADVVDVQVVALAGWPLTGAAGAQTRALVRDAVAIGADLVGGCPHLEDLPGEANQMLIDLASELGCPLDLHTDETLDPSMLSLEDLARRVIATGFPHPVTASHCVSLGVQPPERQHQVAELVARAGIGVVALPQTNLFLQGREHLQAPPRGLTAVAALRRAGVLVAAGADNLQDPFNPMGRADPLEIASLMVVVAHLFPNQALDAITTTAHEILGVAAPAVERGRRADLVALPAATVREAIASAPGERTVIRHGVVTHRGGG
jgi:cytosine deaminase